MDYNPFLTPKHTVAQVSGEKGAREQPMAPDSSDIFVDTTAQRIWLVATDNTGNKVMCTGYDISPYIPEPEVTAKDVDKRLSMFEERFAQFQDKIMEVLGANVEHHS